MHSYDASTRTDLPLPFAAVADLVNHLRGHTDRLVIVGAVARDLVASGAGGLPVARATVDVDIAIAVSSFDAYADLGDIRPRAAGPHHLFRGIPVDVIPFGAVELQRHVRFPDDWRLDVTGIAEAAEHPMQVTLPGGTVVPVASLEAQTVLKLLAWRDRGTSADRKDALDLSTLFEAGHSGRYRDSLYLDPALESYDYDLPTAAAHRLGRDAARLLGDRAHEDVLDVIASDERRDALARAMNGLLSVEILSAYLQGFRDRPPT